MQQQYYAPEGFVFRTWGTHRNTRKHFADVRMALADIKRIVPCNLTAAEALEHFKDHNVKFLFNGTKSAALSLVKQVP